MRSISEHFDIRLPSCRKRSSVNGFEDTNYLTISLLAIQLFKEKGTEDMNGFSELRILLSQLVHDQPGESMSVLSI